MQGIQGEDASAHGIADIQPSQEQSVSN